MLSNLIMLLSTVAVIIMKLNPEYSCNQTDYFSESIVATKVVEWLEVFCNPVGLDLQKWC